MHKIKSNLIQEKISSLRKKGGKDFQSNYFLTPLKEEILFNENEGAFIFLNKEHNFYRMYYAFIDEGSLISILNTLENLPISLEIITRNEIGQNLKEIFSKYFCYDTTFEKLRIKNIENLRRVEFVARKEITYAEIKEAKAVYNAFHKEFYQYSSHLPSINEIEDYIKNRQIIALRKEEKLLAAALYIKKGNCFNFDQIVNIEGNSCNILKLYNMFYSNLKHENLLNGFLWVDCVKNGGLLKFYKNQGYISENQYNQIFISKALETLREDKKFYQI